jgi:hypothetical protein
VQRHCVATSFHLVAALLGIDMDRFDVVAQLHGEAKAFFGDARPAVERNDDQRLGEIVDTDGTVDGVALSTPV